MNITIKTVPIVKYTNCSEEHKYLSHVNKSDICSNTKNLTTAIIKEGERYFSIQNINPCKECCYKYLNDLYFMLDLIIKKILIIE